MGIKAKSFRVCVCERCGYEWIPRDVNKLPEICAGCLSPYWNKPRKNKKKQDVKSAGGSSGNTSRPQPASSRGRGGTYTTATRRDIPRRQIRMPVQRKPTQAEIDKAGIGGAT